MLSFMHFKCFPYQNDNIFDTIKSETLHKALVHTNNTPLNSIKALFAPVVELIPRFLIAVPLFTGLMINSTTIKIYHIKKKKTSWG